MRYATLATILLACSSSATMPAGDAGDVWVPPTDARLPTDAEGFASCAQDMVASCPGVGGGDAMRLYLSASSWHCLQAYDVPPAQIEAARACMCANVGSVEPGAINTTVQRFIRAGCCGRAALPSAWCPDAG